MMVTAEDNLSSEEKASGHREGVTMRNFFTFSLVIVTSRSEKSFGELYGGGEKPECFVIGRLLKVLGLDVPPNKKLRTTY